VPLSSEGVSSEPDLFVVCKNCSSEVSPYVTECPYCGQRVRKRAPKLERGEPVEQRPRRVRPPTLPKLRRGEMPGIAPDTRPNATIALVGLSLLATLVLAADGALLFDFAIVDSATDDLWRVVPTLFPHDNLGYQFVTLVATALFGTHLERRFGATAAVLTFLLAGAAGAALSVVVGISPAIGANGAALGLLCAWLVDDRRAARRGDNRENDLLGVYVIAALLALLPVAAEQASVAAGVGGAAAGALIGLLLSSFRR